MHGGSDGDRDKDKDKDRDRDRGKDSVSDRSQGVFVRRSQIPSKEHPKKCQNWGLSNFAGVYISVCFLVLLPYTPGSRCSANPWCIRQSMFFQGFSYTPGGA